MSRRIPKTSMRLQSAPRRRHGKVIVCLALVLSTLFMVIAYFVDGSMMLLTTRTMQNAADAAATAAAFDAMVGAGSPEQTAESMVREANSHADAMVTTEIPPVSGLFAGQDGYVEVTLHKPYEGYFLKAASLTDPVSLRVRAVAGTEAATGPAAVVVLDPDPSPITLTAIPVTLPSVNPLIGGLEVVGLGRFDVDGAIHVNNTWSGFDEHGNQVGTSSPLLASACTCTPVLPLTRVRATDIRVVGGVDNPDNYSAVEPGEPAPLRANRRPVPDPYSTLPVPTLSVDSGNIAADEFGGQTIVSVPLLTPPQTLKPGVYEWIEIVGGRITFEPGVYVIRSRNPLTGIGLSIIGAQVNADGVMFYLTDSESYSVVTGAPDIDDESLPAPSVSSLFPSAVIGNLLANSRFAPLDDLSSPFHGMLVFQHRLDRRPIILLKQDILGHTAIAGNIYAKWANVVLAGNGQFQSAIVAGSLRVITAFGIRLEPLTHLPAAYDVFLVE